jgi:hypothetical protein
VTENKTKGSKLWLWITLGVSALLVGAVVFYGQVIYPDVRKEQIAKNNVIACQGFYEAVRAEKKDLKDAMMQVLNASDDAIELYDPQFNDADPDFGEVYEAFLRLSDAGISAISTVPEVGVGNFNREVVRTQEICYKIVVAAEREKLRQTPAPTN